MFDAYRPCANCSKMKHLYADKCHAQQKPVRILTMRRTPISEAPQSDEAADRPALMPTASIQFLHPAVEPRIHPTRLEAICIFTQHHMRSRKETALWTCHILQTISIFLAQALAISFASTSCVLDQVRREVVPPATLSLLNAR